MRFKNITVIFFLLVVCCGTSLFSGRGEGDSKDGQWRQNLLHSRLDKDREFKTSPTSPMAAVKRLTVTPGPKTFVIGKNRDFKLSSQKEPDSKFSLVFQKESWIWDALAPGITCKSGGVKIVSGSSLVNGARFRVGDCVIVAYISKKGLVLIVFDPMRPEFKKFSHLAYFPPAPEFVVPAKLIKFKKVSTITTLTSQNLEKTYYRYAEIRFRLEGKDFRLTALKYSLAGEGADTLFIPFGDKTNGKATYGAGRFLDIPEPDGNEFILDFNYCYNPLCNYAHDAYNCPFPPLENILDVSIEAGEKIYSHSLPMADNE